MISKYFTVFAIVPLFLVSVGLNIYQYKNKGEDKEAAEYYLSQYQVMYLNYQTLEKKCDSASRM